MTPLFRAHCLSIYAADLEVGAANHQVRAANHLAVPGLNCFFETPICGRFRYFNAVIVRACSATLKSIHLMNQLIHVKVGMYHGFVHIFPGSARYKGLFWTIFTFSYSILFKRDCGAGPNYRANGGNESWLHKTIMKNKVITICIISSLNVLLEDTLQKHQTSLIPCAATEEAHQLMSEGDYCLVVMDTSALTSERATASVKHMRIITDAPLLAIAPLEISSQLLEAGADICLPDHMPQETIVSHALSLLRRYTLYDHYDKIQPDKRAIQRGDIFIDPRRHTVLVRDKPIELRLREFLLLHYFMRNPYLVLSHEQICQGAWRLENGYGSDVSGPVAILRRAIEPDLHKPVYIETVHQVGYRFTAYPAETCDN